MLPSEPAISPGLRELLTGLLERNPRTRITLLGALQHAWTTMDGMQPLQALRMSQNLPQAQPLHPMQGQEMLLQEQARQEGGIALGASPPLLPPSSQSQLTASVAQQQQHASVSVSVASHPQRIAVSTTEQVNAIDRSHSVLFMHAALKECTFAKGEYLFKQGDEAHCVFMVMSGVVEVVQPAVPGISHHHTDKHNEPQDLEGNTNITAGAERAGVGIGIGRAPKEVGSNLQPACELAWAERLAQQVEPAHTGHAFACAAMGSDNALALAACSALLVDDQPSTSTLEPAFGCASYSVAEPPRLSRQSSLPREAEYMGPGKACTQQYGLLAMPADGSDGMNQLHCAPTARTAMCAGEAAVSMSPAQSSAHMRRSLSSMRVSRMSRSTNATSPLLAAPDSHVQRASPNRCHSAASLLLQDAQEPGTVARSLSSSQVQVHTLNRSEVVPISYGTHGSPEMASGHASCLLHPVDMWAACLPSVKRLSACAGVQALVRTCSDAEQHASANAPAPMHSTHACHATDALCSLIGGDNDAPNGFSYHVSGGSRHGVIIPAGGLMMEGGDDLPDGMAHDDCASSCLEGSLSFDMDDSLTLGQDVPKDGGLNVSMGQSLIQCRGVFCVCTGGLLVAMVVAS